MEVLVGDFHGIGHAGLFLGLHQAAPQRDDTLRKNQNRQPPPQPAQVTQGLWEPLAKARSCQGPQARSRADLTPRAGWGRWWWEGQGHLQGTGGWSQPRGPGALCPKKDFISSLSARPEQGKRQSPALPGYPSPLSPLGPPLIWPWGEATSP